jgi:hypothetical protein
LGKDPTTHPFQTRVESWDDLRHEFEDSKETIISLRLEIEEEGKARAKREATGLATRHDREKDDVVVNFTSRTENSEVRFFLERAVEYIPELEAMFEEKTPNLQFLSSWGAFQLYYGIVIASYFRERDGLNRLRTAHTADTR